jgi:hypothetical protein
MKRRRFAIAGVAAVIAVATAAVALARLAGEEEREPAEDYFTVATHYPTDPGLIGKRAVITRGEDWAFVAWRSTRGLCVSLVLREDEGTSTPTSCGLPVVGAPGETSSRKHLVVGGTYQQRPGDDLWVEGVAAANASRVNVELSDRRRVQVPLYDAPATLGLDLKFFVVRARPPAERQQARVAPFRAFRAYDSDGRLLERFGPPTSEKAAIEAAVSRYETWARRRALRAVDCERPGPLFRGRPAFRCSIRFADSNGLDAHCYALVGRALYEVGGCFDPQRDLGAGKSRLLTRSSQ